MMLFTMMTILYSIPKFSSGHNLIWHQYKEIQYNNGHVKIQTEIFVRRFTHNYWLHNCVRKRDIKTKLLCAELCMSTDDCLSWMYNSINQNCYTCTRVYGTTGFIFSDHFFLGQQYEIYESVVSPRHTTLFKRSSNVIWTLSTLYEPCYDVV